MTTPSGRDPPEGRRLVAPVADVQGTLCRFGRGRTHISRTSLTRSCMDGLAFPKNIMVLSM
jgi:hypothetical protein